MSAVFESILDKQDQPVPVVLNAEEREALEYAAKRLRQEQQASYEDFDFTSGDFTSGDYAARQAQAIESLLARSGSR